MMVPTHLIFIKLEKSKKHFVSSSFAIRCGLIKIHVVAFHALYTNHLDTIFDIHRLHNVKRLSIDQFGAPSLANGM